MCGKEERGGIGGVGVVDARGRWQAGVALYRAHHIIKRFAGDVSGPHLRVTAVACTEILCYVFQHYSYRRAKGRFSWVFMKGCDLDAASLVPSVPSRTPGSKRRVQFNLAQKYCKITSDASSRSKDLWVNMELLPVMGPSLIPTELHRLLM